MKNYVYVATSLDGYIATSDGGVEWLDEIPNPEGNDYGYYEFMSGIDALVMGPLRFEHVETKVHDGILVTSRYRRVRD